MITWEVVGEETIMSRDFHFRGSYHKEIYTHWIHIELSNGVKASSHASAWSWASKSSRCCSASQRYKAPKRNLSSASSGLKWALRSSSVRMRTPSSIRKKRAIRGAFQVNAKLNQRIMDKGYDADLTLMQAAVLWHSCPYPLHWNP